MYWGQVITATACAIVVAAVTSQQGASAVAAILLAVIVYIGFRWLFAIIFRTKYWHRRGGIKWIHCRQCDKHIQRLGGDWIMQCHNCGWKAGYPFSRWLTRSVPVEQLRRTVIGRHLVVFLLAAVLLVAGPVTGTVNTSDVTAVFSDDEVNEKEVRQLVFEKLNERRTDGGYPALSYNDRAAEQAQQHARDMATNDYFSHTSQAGETQQQRYAFCDGGENAHQTWEDKDIRTDTGTERYTSSEELAEGIVKAWMNSRPHRENGIYGEYWSSGGVGIAITDDGKVYAVFGFCQ